ncbi:hypothetical protein N7532_001020 [Penicillium argentinense]|uniref:Uncharacterized protein n=1 Tax=Penicillium argentinense TaxID=1131581 RepID=A0A9W9G1Q8_9EURO|nr:uncharacterized protein N7532_001020 [Penicillium argentinense]KAJ5110485.1 hypothetical protein N7532_001020 [Penicillium argentinense]
MKVSAVMTTLMGAGLVAAAPLAPGISAIIIPSDLSSPPSLPSGTDVPPPPSGTDIPPPKPTDGNQKRDGQPPVPSESDFPPPSGTEVPPIPPSVTNPLPKPTDRNEKRDNQPPLPPAASCLLCPPALTSPLLLARLASLLPPSLLRLKYF